MPRFNSQTLSAARSRDFVLASVPGAGLNDSSANVSAGFAGLPGRRPAFCRPERRAGVLVALRGSSFGAAGAPSAVSSTMGAKGPGEWLLEVSKSGGLVTVAVSDRLHDFIRIRTAKESRYSVKKSGSRSRRGSEISSSLGLGCCGATLSSRVQDRCASRPCAGSEAES